MVFKTVAGMIYSHPEHEAFKKSQNAGSKAYRVKC